MTNRTTPETQGDLNNLIVDTELPNVPSDEMQSTMSVRLFSPEIDDVSRLMEEEQLYDQFIDNIGRARQDEPNLEVLEKYRIAADPMEYLNLESDAPSLQEISSDEEVEQNENEDN